MGVHLRHNDFNPHQFPNLVITFLESPTSDFFLIALLWEYLYLKSRADLINNSWRRIQKWVDRDSVILHMNKLFIRKGIPKHWRLSWFRYETFITFLTFGFSTRGERDTILTMITVRPASTLNLLTQPTRAHPAANNWTRLGSNLN